MKTNKKPVRQTVPLAGLERVYIIDREIASGKFPNNDYLVECMKRAERECRGKKVSKATLYRDIEFMKNRLNAPIEYDAYHRGYYYTQKTFRLPAGFTTAENLLALNMAKNIFTLYRDTPLYEASNNLMESILTPIISDGNKDWLENRIMVPQVASAKVDNTVWDNIISALKQNKIIIFYYQGAWDNEPQFRKVYPYQLLFDSGVWYLYGFSVERKATRIFSVSRISNIKITNDVFTLPKDFNYSNFSGDSYFGVFIGQEKMKFVIDFYEEAIVYITERQWAADQKITDNDEGITIEFASSQYDKIKKWVLSFGCYAVPKKPKKLVDDWNWHVLEMRKMVSK